MELATRRLIDASATLPPADRALLNLWTQRGLDDAAVARMTGMSPEVIVERRERIVAALSDELGLPPEDISGALAEIAASTAAPATTPAVAGDPAPASEDSQPAPEPSPVIPQAEPETEKSAPASDGGERRRLTLAMLVILLAAMAILAIVLVAGGGSKGNARTTSAPPTSTAASASATSSSAMPGSSSMSTSMSSSTSPPTGTPAGSTSPTPLTPLPGPGGEPAAAGTATLQGTGATRTLTVRTHGLAPAGVGHYEVYLYDSIIDSEPIGTLDASGGGTFRIPADAAHYAFVDISHQDSGVNAIPDGASVLRAPNPAHAG